MASMIDLHYVPRLPSPDGFSAGKDAGNVIDLQALHHHNVLRYIPRTLWARILTYGTAAGGVADVTQYVQNALDALELGDALAADAPAAAELWPGGPPGGRPRPVLFFPPGLYGVTGLRWRGWCILEGEHMCSSVIAYIGKEAPTAVIQVIAPPAPPVGSTAGLWSCELRDLTLSGTATVGEAPRPAYLLQLEPIVSEVKLARTRLVHAHIGLSLVGGAESVLVEDAHFENVLNMAVCLDSVDYTETTAVVFERVTSLIDQPGKSTADGWGVLLGHLANHAVDVSIRDTQLVIAQRLTSAMTAFVYLPTGYQGTATVFAENVFGSVGAGSSMAFAGAPAQRIAGVTIGVEIAGLTYLFRDLATTQGIQPHDTLADATGLAIFGALQSPVLNINGRTLGFEDRPASGLGGLERVRHGDVRLGTYPEAGQSAAVFRSVEDDRVGDWTPGDSSEPRGNGFFVVGNGLSVSGKPKARVPFVTFAGATDAIAPKGFFYVDLTFAAPVPFLAGDAINLEMLIGESGSKANPKFGALVLDAADSHVVVGLRRADLLLLAADQEKLAALDAAQQCVCSQRSALASASVAEW